MRALGGLLGRVHQEAGLAVLDLERDAADVAGDRRAALPERLGDGQAEALADRLLQHHVGLGLEGVDLDRADVVEVVEDLDVLVAGRRARWSAGRSPSPRGRRSPSSRPARAARPGSPPSPSGRRRSRRAGPSRGRSARPGRSAAGRRRRRTGRRRRRRPRARAPCSSATAGRSRAARSRPCRRRPSGTYCSRWKTLAS